jgi:hypothetical protein
MPHKWKHFCQKYNLHKKFHEKQTTVRKFVDTGAETSRDAVIAFTKNPLSQARGDTLTLEQLLTKSRQP